MVAIKGLPKIAAATYNTSLIIISVLTYLWFCRGQRFRWRLVAWLPWRWRLRSRWRFHCWLHLARGQW